MLPNTSQSSLSQQFSSIWNHLWF